jgi:hypothetical protein
MRNVETGKRRWVDARPGHPVPKPGWIVLFGWDTPSRADHCGIVIKGAPREIETLEFNTAGTINGNQISGGAVLKKTRPYDGKIIGFIATDQKAPLGI